MSSSHSWPVILFCAVVNGITTKSSWSRPVAENPLAWSTPITRKGTAFTLMVLPMGSSSPNKLAATVWPSTQTAALFSRSSWVKPAPSAISHLRISKLLRAHTPILRAPVEVAVNHLDVAVDVRRSALDAGHLLENGLRISSRQRLGAAAAHADSIAGTAAGFNPNQVVTNFAELVFHAAGAGLAYSNHADERAHTHDDAEHGQHAANPVADQSFEHFAKNSFYIHAKLFTLRKSSFIAQGFDGIQPGCLLRGVISKKDANRHGHGRGAGNRCRRNQDRPANEERNGIGKSHSQHDTDCTAHQADDQRFNQELLLHVGFRRADGHADADLPSPLRDRHP